MNDNYSDKNNDDDDDDDDDDVIIIIMIIIIIIIIIIIDIITYRSCNLKTYSYVTQDFMSSTKMWRSTVHMHL